MSLQGFPLESLTERLPYLDQDSNGKMDDLHPAIDTIEDIQGKLSRYSKYFKDYGFDTAKFKEEWHRYCVRSMSGFSFADICKAHHSSYIMSEFHDAFGGRPEGMFNKLNHRRQSGRATEEQLDSIYRYYRHYRVYGKIGNSAWVWGHNSLSWNTQARYFNSVPNFNFGIEGFETTWIHTTGCNEWGYTEEKITDWDDRPWLDAPCGYYVHFKGKPVLMISFAFAPEGILLSQIQLKNKKGNRWLYKLPIHQTEHVVNQMKIAFPDSNIYFVEGTDLCAKILYSYKLAKKENPRVRLPSAETIMRTERVYNRDFELWERGDEVRQQGMVFYKLERKAG